MPGKVSIIVEKGGKITVSANGIKGPSCQPLIEQITQKITGSRMIQGEHTAEFYEKGNEQIQR